MMVRRAWTDGHTRRSRWRHHVTAGQPWWRWGCAVKKSRRRSGGEPGTGPWTPSGTAFGAVLAGRIVRSDRLGGL